jgi:hypothetical protein
VTIQEQGSFDPRPGGGYVLGLPMHIVVDAEDGDGDNVTLRWELRAPVGGGSDPDAVTFEPENDRKYLFTADVPGLWEVRVTAEDGVGGVTQETRQILIEPDQAPCIALTDPIAVAGGRYVVERSEGARRFSVLSVTDALDVYPLSADAAPQLGETAFRWRIATPDTGGTLVPISGHSAADYVLDPDALSPGDEVILQIEAHDRVARALCPSAEPTCSIDGDSCFQRLTWEVEIR